MRMKSGSYNFEGEVTSIEYQNNSIVEECKNETLKDFIIN